MYSFNIKYLIICVHCRAQTEEYDYEKDEDDPRSDGEVDLNEKESECDNSINLDDEDNTLMNQIKSENLKDDIVEKSNRSEKDYSGIIIDVTE